MKIAVLGPGIRAMKRKASPSMREKTMPMAVSGLNSPRSARGPMAAAANRLKAKAPAIGLSPTSTPRRAPAKAAWDRPTPMREMRMATTKTPTEEQATPLKRAARIAFCMKR